MDVDTFVHERQTTAVAAVFALSPNLARLLQVFVGQSGVVPMDTIRNYVGEPWISVHRLNQTLLPFGVKIVSHRGVGYTLPADSRELLLAWFGAELERQMGLTSEPA